MKKIILIILVLSLNNNLFSQDFKELHSRIEKFDTQSDYDNVDKEILVAVDYLLTKPYREKSEKYFYAYKSLMTWMDKTTNYHIQIGGKVLESCDKGSLMINLLMASMTKYLLIEHLENNRYIHPKKIEGTKYTDLKDVREIMYGGADIFMKYLENQDKKLLNRKLRKALKAHRKGKLREFMFE